MLNSAFEVSSMGIRVDENSVVEQLRTADLENRLHLPYYQEITASYPKTAPNKTTPKT